MDEDIKNELNKITEEELNEDLSTMSVEDIMREGHFTRDAAEAIWEAEHNIGITEYASVEELFKRLDELCSN